MKYPKLYFRRQLLLWKEWELSTSPFLNTNVLQGERITLKGPLLCGSPNDTILKRGNTHSCHKMTYLMIDFEEPIKPSTSVSQKNVLCSSLSNHCWKVTGHSGRQLEMGLQKHLAFNGFVAVVKQCAEIILIRLGQSGCIIRLASPPFSFYCSEHNHSLRHHFK